MVGLTGEVGVDVQYPVEVDPDHGQGHVLTPVHNMKETTVQEVRTRVVTAALIPVLVSDLGFSNFDFEIWLAHKYMIWQRLSKITVWTYFQFMEAGPLGVPGWMFSQLWRWNLVQIQILYQSITSTRRKQLFWTLTEDAIAMTTLVRVGISTMISLADAIPWSWS